MSRIGNKNSDFSCHIKVRVSHPLLSSAYLNNFLLEANSVLCPCPLLIPDDTNPPAVAAPLVEVAGWEVSELALVLLLLNPRCFSRSLAVQPATFLMFTSAPATSERVIHMRRAKDVFMRGIVYRSGSGRLEEGQSKLECVFFAYQ